ncbi:MAG: DUF3592 domain-containing protein [Rubritepida sp.]|jgi:hypothetical protein|nr:DUF3592 domain-containing protein [Rubritepida sp.]
MITLLRLVAGSGCLAIGAACIMVALRQYRREVTWWRTIARVERSAGPRETDLSYTDADGMRRTSRHWGISSTTGTGAEVTILHHPKAPERIALIYGPGVLAILTLAGMASGLLGLWMLANVFSG